MINTQYRNERNSCSVACDTSELNCDISVADLEGGPRGPGPPFRPKFTIKNVSKTQDLRPKIREYFALLGGGPPVFGAAPPFRNFWIRHCIYISFYITAKDAFPLESFNKDVNKNHMQYVKLN
jgi:hypothetical protein